MSLINDRYGQVNNQTGNITKINDNFWKRYTSKDVYEWNQYAINHYYTWRVYSINRSLSAWTINPDISIGSGYTDLSMAYGNDAFVIGLLDPTTSSASYIKIFTSNNGINWSSGDYFNSGSSGITQISIAYGEENFILAMLLTNGVSSYYIKTIKSSNGSSWNTSNAYTQRIGSGYTDLSMTYGNGMFVIALLNTSSNPHRIRCFKSSDGINWGSEIPVTDSGYYKQVSISFINNQFVITAINVNGSAYDGVSEFTSSDGNTWKRVGDILSGTYSYASTAYENGLYIMILASMNGNSYSGLDQYTSLNGNSWSGHNSIDSSTLSKPNVIYASGKFVLSAIYMNGNSSKHISSKTSTLTVSAGSATGAIVSSSSISSYPNDGQKGDFWYTYIEDSPSKGSSLGITTSNSSSSYPSDDISGNYWYTYSRSYKSPDVYLNTVGSINSSTYPTNGVASDGYYYIKQ